MLRIASFSMYLLLLPLAFLNGCGRGQGSSQIDYQMGNRVTVGPLTYNVIETTWRSQLGGEFSPRIPQQRFLLITVQVTNGGGKDISVPLLTVENQNGEKTLESDSGEGVDGWFGLLRTLSPAQTEQGKLVFDVPLSSYRLRLTDGGDPGTEKYAWVTIPLHMDGDQFESPVPATPPIK